MAIEEKKKVSVSIDPEVRSPQIYHQFLITSTENALHIDLADSVETNDEKLKSLFPYRQIKC